MEALRKIFVAVVACAVFVAMLQYSCTDKLPEDITQQGGDSIPPPGASVVYFQMAHDNDSLFVEQDTLLEFATIVGYSTGHFCCTHQFLDVVSNEFVLQGDTAWVRRSDGRETGIVVYDSTAAWTPLCDRLAGKYVPIYMRAVGSCGVRWSLAVSPPNEEGHVTHLVQAELWTP